MPARLSCICSASSVVLLPFTLISLHVLVAITTFKILSLDQLSPIGPWGVAPHVLSGPSSDAWIDRECRASRHAGAGVLDYSPTHSSAGDARKAVTPDFWSALSMAAGSVLLAFMSWKAPSYMSELLGARIAVAADSLIAMVSGGSYGAARLGRETSARGAAPGRTRA